MHGWLPTRAKKTTMNTALELSYNTVVVGNLVLSCKMLNNLEMTFYRVLLSAMEFIKMLILTNNSCIKSVAPVAVGRATI